MTKESNIEVAYKYVASHKEPSRFEDIWKEVVRVQGFSEEEANDQIGRFYTNMSLDGRFVTLTDNTWDLRSRCTFEQVHIDMNDAYSDEVPDEDEGSDEPEDEEERAYQNQLKSPEELAEEENEKEENEPRNSEEEDY